MKRFTLYSLSILIAMSMVLAACQPSSTPTEAVTTVEPTKAVVVAEPTQAVATEEPTQVVATEEPTEVPTESAVMPKYGGVLRIGTGQTPPVLGYTPMSTNNSFIQFLQVCFDSLLFYDEAGNLAPRLATSWETDSTAKTITFHLREGVKFSDGTDFNADAVKWNIEQYQTAKRTETANIESVEVVDDYTAVLHLIAWDSSNLEGVGFFVYYMSPTAVEANGSEWAQKNPVGTGPFTLAEWNEGVSIKYVKNPNYWQEGKPYLDGIEFSIIADTTTLETALVAGEIDLISYTSLLSVKNLVDTGDFIRETNANGVGVESTGVLPNSNDPNSPFYDVRVRQAFCYAIDRDAIIQTVGYGLLTGTDQWAAPGAKTYNPNVEGYPYNPDKARELLTEAGYPDGFDTVIFSGAGDDMMTAIADMLTAVGIRAEVQVSDAATLFGNMANGWEGVMYHWASIGPDLGLYMGRHLDPNGAYFAKGIQHPQDALDLLQQIRTAPDETTKLQYEWELQKVIYDKYALFGKVLYVTSINTMKYPYVMDDNWTKFTGASWTPENTWLDQ